MSIYNHLTDEEKEKFENKKKIIQSKYAIKN